MAKKLPAVPFLLWILCGTLIPLLMVFYYGFTDRTGAFTMNNILAIFQPVHLKALGLSLLLSLISTVICMVLAYPLALVLRYSSFGKKGFIIFIFILPMWMNFLLRTMAWQVILERNGIFEIMLRHLHLPMPAIINTPAAIVLGMVYDFLPFMVLPIYNSLMKIDENLIEAAYDLGADKGTVYRKVIFPLLVPGIVRSRKAGGYEIISGHRRKRASEIAGRMTMPVIVRDLPDDEAIIAMVDSNFQREYMLPSEKAKAYKMKYNAMKHQGKNKGIGRSIDAIGDEVGESGKTIQRYVHLAELIDEMLQMLDDKKLGLAQGYEISFIRPNTQRMIAEVIMNKDASVSGAQAAKLKEYAERDELTEAMVELILSEEQPKPKRMVLKPARIEKIFQKFSFTQEEMEEKIYQVLEEWASQQK